MAKTAKVVSDGIDKELLTKVVAATDANQLMFLSPAEGLAFVKHVPQLIEVNTEILDPNDNTKAAVRATADAKAYLAAVPATNEQRVNAEAHVASNYAVITGAVLPEAKKRGNTTGSGAPTKYPFAVLEVGGAFFSANSEHKNGDAVKALGSTVSSQNNKYSEPTGEMKTVTRAVRDEDNKAKLDATGAKITETVQLPVKKYNRKFTIRPVTGGQSYGSFIAPVDGALIARTV